MPLLLTALCGVRSHTGSRYISRLPGTAGKKVVPRISMDSHASSTPEAMMMMMSPGMTALLQRYTEGTRTSVTPPLFSDGNAAQLLEIGRGATPGVCVCVSGCCVGGVRGITDGFMPGRNTREELVWFSETAPTLSPCRGSHTTANPLFLNGYWDRCSQGQRGAARRVRSTK